MAYAQTLVPPEHWQEQNVCYRKTYKQYIKSKRSASPFRFGAANHQIGGCIYAILPLPNGKPLRMKTNMVSINVPLLVTEDIFTDHGITLNFENTCSLAKLKMKYSTTLLSWKCTHITKTNSKICKFTYKQQPKLHYSFMHP